MDCSPAGYSVHGISQARILEWIAISFSRGFSQLRDQTHVSGNGLRHLGSPKKQESPSIPSCPSHLQDTASWQLDIKHQYPGDASPTDLHRTPDIPGEIRAERNWSAKMKSSECHLLAFAPNSRELSAFSIGQTAVPSEEGQLGRDKAMWTQKCFRLFQTGNAELSMWVLGCFSCKWLFATLWTLACQVFLSKGFSRQEYWSGFLCPPVG